jgi:hypothetical protein
MLMLILPCSRQGAQAADASGCCLKPPASIAIHEWAKPVHPAIIFARKTSFLSQIDEICLF